MEALATPEKHEAEILNVNQQVEALTEKPHHASDNSLPLIATEKKTRQDAMALAIEEVCRRLRTSSAQNIMTDLRGQVGKDGTCVVAILEDGVQWGDGGGGKQILTLSNLMQRIRRRKVSLRDR